MIRSYFGVAKTPFDMDEIELLPHQEDIYEILRVHSSQGGLCLVMGLPGTGKTELKRAIQERSDKTTIVVTVSRTLHTYTNTLKIFCDAFKVQYSGSSYICERRLIQEARTLKRQGKTIITVIDDAHLLEMETLRKLRLMFEEFPRNHNVVLIGQPVLLNNLNLTINDDIKSRVTFSAIMKPISSDEMKEYIYAQLDKAQLGHNTFTEEAIDLIVRSSEGILRKTRNLCAGSLLQAVRAQTKKINLKVVNSVLIQPHWRKEKDIRLN